MKVGGAGLRARRYHKLMVRGPHEKLFKAADNVDPAGRPYDGHFLCIGPGRISSHRFTKFWVARISFPRTLTPTPRWV